MANNLLQKTVTGAKNALSSLVHGTQKLKDPNNVESQITRADQVKPDSEPSVGEAKELIDLGERRYTSSRQGRVRHNADLYTGIAFYQGNQHSQWAEGKGTMLPINQGNPDFDERFIAKHENVLQGMVDRAVSRMCASYPDAWAAPLTDSDKDKAAAQIHRAINAHCSRVTNREKKLRDAALAICISSTVFIKCAWDAKGEADLGFPQADGSIEYKRAQVGEVTNSLMLAIDAYPDPNAALTDEGIHGGAYFIERNIRSLDFIKRKWGKTVEATAYSDTYGSLEQRLEWIAGDHSRSQSAQMDSTEVTEMWEKPSDQYPKGRFIVWSADKTLLHAGPWPYEKKDKYPFVAIEFKKNQASVWALNMVKPMIPVQQTLNRLASYLAGRLEWDRPVLVVEKSAGIAPDDLINPNYGQVIPFDKGSEPHEWKFPPSPGDFYFALEKSLLNKMEMLAGVRDFNADGVTDNDSGYKVDLKIQLDKERLAITIKGLQEAVVELYEWDAALYKQFGGQFQRILGLNDKAVPAQSLQGPNAAASAMVDLQALRDGQCRVVLSPGSGISKLPAAQEEALQEMVQIMAKGIPSPMLEFWLNQSQNIRSDVETDRLIQGYKVYEQQQQQAQQAAQMAVQGLRGSQQEQQLQMKAQQEQQAAQIESQQEQEKAAIAVHAAAVEQQNRTNADLTVEHFRAQNALAQIQAKSQTPTIAITFDGSNDPTAQASAEKAAGLSAGPVSTIKEMAKPPIPAANPGAGKKPVAKKKAK